VLHQRQVFPLAATLAVSMLAACGGGGSTGSSSLPLTTPASPAASSTPVAVATATPAAAPLGTATLAGAPGFVNAQSHTVYVFDADLAAPGTSTCSGQCATVWPIVAATANVAYPAPFTAIKRADGTLQLAYSGRPLYTYIADSAAGSIAGNGITSFGAVWHIARPAGAVTATPEPTATPTVAPTTGPTAAPTPFPGY
jgi:predicted lipoprotein with Yx(FWY)xxD motif